MPRLTKRTLAILAAGMMSATALPAIAQDASTPQSWSSREEQAPWENDPAFHEFYRATVEAFANGPDRVDLAVFESRCREIFTAFAIANNMPVASVLDHVKAIPGEMIGNARREPEILASYEAFMEALRGPRSFPADAAERIGGGE